MYLLPFSCSYFTLRFHYLLLEVPIYFGAAHLRSFTEEDGGEPYDHGCWRGKVQDWDGAGLVVEDESEFLTGQWGDDLV